MAENGGDFLRRHKLTVTEPSSDPNLQSSMFVGRLHFTYPSFSTEPCNNMWPGMASSPHALSVCTSSRSLPTKHCHRLTTRGKFQDVCCLIYTVADSKSTNHGCIRYNIAMQLKLCADCEIDRNGDRGEFHVRLAGDPRLFWHWRRPFGRIRTHHLLHYGCCLALQKVRARQRIKIETLLVANR